MNNKEIINQLNGMLYESAFILGTIFEFKNIFYDKTKVDKNSINKNVLNHNRKKFRKYLNILNENHNNLLKLFKKEKNKPKTVIEIYKSLYIKIYKRIDMNYDDLLEKNIEYIFANGFLNGLYFIKKKSEKRYFLNKKIMVFIFDINDFYIFTNKILNRNSIENFLLESKIEHLKNEIKITIDKEKYYTSGHFSNSDFLLHLKDTKDEDTLIINEIKFKNNILLDNNIQNDDIEENLKNHFHTILNQLFNKNIIENLNMEDNLKSLKLGLFNKNVKKIMPLLGKSETLKINQAVSYAKSYLEYLKEYEDYKDNFNLNIYGTDNLEINSINYKREPNKSIDFLIENLMETSELYTEKKLKEEDEIKTLNLDVEKKMNCKISNKTEYIKFIEKFEKNKMYSFNLSKQLDIEKVSNITSIDLRKEHTKKFLQLIKEKDILIALGSPGIGKTTSVVGYLTQLENYVFMYTSSRIAVNEDILNKIKSDSSNKHIFGSDEMQEYYGLNRFDNNEFIKDNISFTVNSDLTKNDMVLIDCKESAKKINENITNKNREYISLEDYDLLPEKEKEKQTDSIDKHHNRIKNGGSVGVLESISNGVSEVLSYTDKRKITTTFAIQAFFPKTLEKLMNFIKDMEKNNMNNLIIMLDEITGTNQSYDFIKGIVQFFYLDNGKELILKKEVEINKNIIKLPNNFNLKLVISDASLSNKEVLKKYLNTQEKDSDSKIISGIKKDIKKENGCFVEKLTNEELSHTILNFDENKIDILNVNCYPAKKLNINYDFHLTNEKLNVLKIILVEFKVWYFKNKETDFANLIFLQNKKEIEKFVDMVIDDKDIDLTINDIMIINSNTIKEQKKDLNEIISKSKLIMTTSTASRGISFKKVNDIMVVVPSFDIENQLNEIIQIIYRQRGDSKFDENGEKNLNFIIHHKLDLDEHLNKEIREINRKLYVYNILFLIESVIYTRLQGFYKFNRNKFQVIPFSLKGMNINQDKNKIEDNIHHIIKQITKLNSYNKKFDNLLSFLTNVFDYNIFYKNNDVIHRLNNTLNKLLHKSDFNALVNKQIKIKDKSFFDNVSMDSQMFFIKDDVSLEIENNQSILGDDNTIQSYKDSLYEMKYFLLEKEKNKTNKDLVVDFVQLIQEILFEERKNHTYNDKKTVKKTYMIPLYYFLLFNDKTLYDYEYDRKRKKILVNEEEVNTFLNFLKMYSMKKYRTNENKIIPKVMNTNYNHKNPFILIGENFFKQQQDKIYHKNNLSNLPILSSMNILFLKEFEE
jgi:hypothetical protein